MRLLSVLLAALFMVSCATVKETYSGDGKKAYTLNCSGTARGWDKCYAAAGEICKTAGYTVLEKSSEESGSLTGVANSNGAVVSGHKSNERSMVIVCK